MADKWKKIRQALEENLALLDDHPNYVPLTKDIKLGRAVSEYMWAKRDEPYLLPRLVNRCYEADLPVGVTTLYMARKSYLESLQKPVGRKSK